MLISNMPSPSISASAGEAENDSSTSTGHPTNRCPSPSNAYKPPCPYKPSLDAPITISLSPSLFRSPITGDASNLPPSTDVVQSGSFGFFNPNAERLPQPETT